MSTAFQEMWAHNRETFALDRPRTQGRSIKTLKVHVRDGGGIYRARYHGRKIQAFGHTAVEAIKKLRFLENTHE